MSVDDHKGRDKADPSPLEPQVDRGRGDTKPDFLVDVITYL